MSSCLYLWGMAESKAESHAKNMPSCFVLAKNVHIVGLACTVYTELEEVVFGFLVGLMLINHLASM